MKLRDFIDRSLRFGAKMLAEPDGTPSAGRVVLFLAAYTVATVCVVLLFRHADLAKELAEYFMTTGAAVYGLNKGAAILSK